MVQVCASRGKKDQETITNFAQFRAVGKFSVTASRRLLAPNGGILAHPKNESHGRGLPWDIDEQTKF
jgi:hypothetical protein